MKDICQIFQKLLQLGPGQEVEKLFMSSCGSGKIVVFEEDVQRQNHFNLKLNVMIMLIREVMMIQITNMKNLWKMVIHQLIQMKDLMNHL